MFSLLLRLTSMVLRYPKTITIQKLYQNQFWGSKSFWKLLIHRPKLQPATLVQRQSKNKNCVLLIIMANSNSITLFKCFQYFSADWLLKVGCSLLCLTVTKSILQPTCKPIYFVPWTSVGLAPKWLLRIAIINLWGFFFFCWLDLFSFSWNSSDAI